MKNKTIATEIFEKVLQNNIKTAAKPPKRKRKMSLGASLLFPPDPLEHGLLQCELRYKKRGNAKGGETTATHRQPVKEWCLKRAFEIRQYHPNYSKRRIAMKIAEEMHEQKWPDGVIPLTESNAANTLEKSWLPKGKPTEWKQPE